MSDGFYFRKGYELFWTVPVASGTVIAIGDLLYITSGKAALMRSGGDNLDFIGPAKSAHGATDPSTTLQVYLPAPWMIFEYPLDAATDVSVGNNLAWNAAQKLTKNDTNPIATAMASKLQATKIRCVFRMPAATSTNIRLGTGDAS
jgi:predicted RecA/RadA family phage recombinase